MLSLLCKAFFTKEAKQHKMIYDLQKASVWKRIASGVFDAIIAGILIVGVALLLSSVLGYDKHNDTYTKAYNEYEKEYGVDFDISETEYGKLTEEEKNRYQSAYEAFIGDDNVLYSYNMIINLSLLTATLSVFISYLSLEFIVPLFIGNGQTVGKKIFGIGIMRTDGVRVTNFQLFVRTVLGKFTVETMIPVYIVLMIFWNMMDITGTFVLLIILLTQIIMITVTRTNSLLHDMLAVTVTVDIGSQMIFDTEADKIEYQKKLAAERAARQTY